MEKSLECYEEEAADLQYLQYTAYVAKQVPRWENLTAVFLCITIHLECNLQYVFAIQPAKLESSFQESKKLNRLFSESETKVKYIVIGK